MRAFLTLLIAAILSAPAAFADASIQQKTQLHFGGALGSVINVFGRKATHEGIVTDVAIRKNRKSSRSGDNGEIVDLDQQKIYYVDYEDRTYTVKTFDELRKEYQDAKARAKEREQKTTRSADKNEGPEYEVDFSLKSTGNKETINGWNTHEEIATVTVHEKGKKLEESGGFVMTSDMWMGPRVPAMRELADFERRFLQKVYGDALIGDMQQMAAMVAATPAFAKAMKAFNDRQSKFEGTAIRTKMTFESVAGTNPDSSSQSQSSSPAGAIGGLLGRMKQRRQKDESGATRGTMLDSNHELLKASTSASADAVAIPAGFKLK
ncbi:MAG: hypothetical protein M3041_09125 [Acidobacteriota bacterium]|nr:hypothetical protein [Acidobacteriota bacterium]